MAVQIESLYSRMCVHQLQQLARVLTLQCHSMEPVGTKEHTWPCLAPAVHYLAAKAPMCVSVHKYPLWAHTCLCHNACQRTIKGWRCQQTPSSKPISHNNPRMVVSMNTIVKITIHNNPRMVVSRDTRVHISNSCAIIRIPRCWKMRCHCHITERHSCYSVAWGQCLNFI